LALLADATGNDRIAVALHQAFKWEFVARFPKEGFKMASEAIQAWATEQAKKVDLSAWEDEQWESGAD
jgi:hypothetical protein